MINKKVIALILVVLVASLLTGCVPVKPGSVVQAKIDVQIYDNIYLGFHPSSAYVCTLSSGDTATVEQVKTCGSTDCEGTVAVRLVSSKDSLCEGWITQGDNWADNFIIQK